MFFRREELITFLLKVKQQCCVLTEIIQDTVRCLPLQVSKVHCSLGHFIRRACVIESVSREHGNPGHNTVIPFSLQGLRYSHPCHKKKKNPWVRNAQFKCSLGKHLQRIYIFLGSLNALVKLYIFKHILGESRSNRPGKNISQTVKIILIRRRRVTTLVTHKTEKISCSKIAKREPWYFELLERLTWHLSVGEMGSQVLCEKKNVLTIICPPLVFWTSHDKQVSHDWSLPEMDQNCRLFRVNSYFTNAVSIRVPCLPIGAHRKNIVVKTLLPLKI